MVVSTLTLSLFSVRKKADSIQVILQAYGAGAKRLLVFEDDIVPTPASQDPVVIQNAERFVREATNWDILYLGYLPVNQDWIRGSSFLFASYDPRFPGIVQYNPLFTHAFCYSHRAMQTILGKYEGAIGTIHYDVWLANKLALRNFCCVPMLFEQGLAASSSIPAHDLLEVVLRRMTYYTEKYMICYRISTWKSWMNGHLGVVYFFLLLLVLVVIMVMYKKKKN